MSYNGKLHVQPHGESFTGKTSSGSSLPQFRSLIIKQRPIAGDSVGPPLQIIIIYSGPFIKLFLARGS